MKAFALVLLLPLFAIDTSDLKNAEARRFSLGDSVTVTVKRKDLVRTVTIERLGVTNSYTIAPVDGQMRITGRSFDGPPIQLPQPVSVDGVMLDSAPLPAAPAPGGPTFFICPEDETMVRVRPGKVVGELRCPLDGTTMRRAVGRGRQYFLLQ